MGTRTALDLPPIVSAAWLADNLESVIVFDVRAYLDDRNGRDAYNAGHIRGARFIDLETELSDIGDPMLGRHPLPAPERFAEVLGQHGVDHLSRVVAYDDAGGAIAARLVWMLRVLGQRAAILDGGIDAWTGELSTTTPPFAPVDHSPRPWPAGAVVDADGVHAFAVAGGVLVDSRAPARYRGEIEPIDSAAGHVPGAINLPFADNLADGFFLDAAVLKDRFETVGVDDTAVFYCGSGVTACHNILAAEAAGIGRPRLYVGSWSGWSSQGRPVATAD